METVLEQAAAAGARTAGYVILRLPNEVKQLFREVAWRPMNPGKTDHVFSIIRDLRSGREKRSRLFHPDAWQRRVCRFGPKTVSECLPEIRPEQRKRRIEHRTIQAARYCESATILVLTFSVQIQIVMRQGAIPAQAGIQLITYSLL